MLRSAATVSRDEVECLDRLGAWIDGAAAGAPEGGATPEWRVLYDGYVAAGLPAGAAIPE